MDVKTLSEWIMAFPKIDGDEDKIRYFYGTKLFLVRNICLESLDRNFIKTK